MGDWRPIETAPKDKTPILVYDGDWFVVKWHEGEWCVVTQSGRAWTGGYPFIMWRPTHWQELTEPPDDDSED